MQPDEFDPAVLRPAFAHMPTPEHHSIQLVLSGRATQALRGGLSQWVVRLPLETPAAGVATAAGAAAAAAGRVLPACTVAFGAVYPTAAQAPTNADALDFDAVQGGWVYSQLSVMRERCVFRENGTPEPTDGDW